MIVVKQNKKGNDLEKGDYLFGQDSFLSLFIFYFLLLLYITSVLDIICPLILFL
jgi:hypothetical protein